MVTIVISAKRRQAAAAATSSHDEPKAVSSDDQTFTIHKGYVCLASPFFAAAFNGNFLEGENQSMRLDDVDPAVFGLLVHWIYYQKFDMPTFENQGGKSTADYEKLAELWILGQRTIMPALQNYVVDIILNSLSEQDFWDGSNFGRLMEVAAENDTQSPLSSLAINAMVYSDAIFFDAQVSSTPPSLAIPIMKGLKLNNTERKYWIQGMGKNSGYHV